MSEEEDRKKHLEDIDKLLADKLSPTKKDALENKKSAKEKNPDRRESVREEPSAEEKPCNYCGETFNRKVRNTDLFGLPVCPHCGSYPDKWYPSWKFKPRTARIIRRCLWAIILISIVGALFYALTG